MRVVETTDFLDDLGDRVIRKIKRTTEQDEMHVQAIKNNESFSVLVSGEILCQMATGGCHRFRTKLEAEVYGRRYARGNTGGSYLSGDVDNFVTGEQQ